MKAIHLTAYGNPAQNLKLVELPEPNAPSAGEALVSDCPPGASCGPVVSCLSSETEDGRSEMVGRAGSISALVCLLTSPF